MIQHPEQRRELERRILDTFSLPKAILVLDMSGFSRTTHQYGIVTFLLMIHQTRRLSLLCVQKNRGVLVKAEADNLYCLFDTVPDAVAAARANNERLETANCVLPDEQRLYASIGIGFGDTLYVGEEDLFGDEVNLACKLGEDIAESGQILLTAAAAAVAPEIVAGCEKSTLSISGLAMEYWKLP
jgi:class 3 adenylate cyclase